MSEPAPAQPSQPSQPSKPGSGAEYLRPYELAVERFGPTFEATLWHSKERQCERFGVICRMVDLRGARILDAGCGLGDLAAYLHDHHVEFDQYVGLEAMDDLVDSAAARGLARARFAVADFVDDSGAFAGHFPRAEAGRPDIVVFSGSLNTLDEDRARVVIDRAWEACRRSVVFNFLSSRNGVHEPPDPSPARRFDPVAMLDWTLSRTPRVILRQDYMGGHDGTIAMLRAEEPGHSS